MAHTPNVKTMHATYILAQIQRGDAGISAISAAIFCQLAVLVHATELPRGRQALLQARREKPAHGHNFTQDGMHTAVLFTSAIHRGKKEYESLAPASSAATSAASLIAKSITPAQNSPSYGLDAQWASHRLTTTKLRPARMARTPEGRISCGDPTAPMIL
jgi:hypothetical protein